MELVFSIGFCCVELNFLRLSPKSYLFRCLSHIGQCGSRALLLSSCCLQPLPGFLLTCSVIDRDPMLDVTSPERTCLITGSLYFAPPPLSPPPFLIHEELGPGTWLCLGALCPTNSSADQGPGPGTSDICSWEHPFLCGRTWSESLPLFPPEMLALRNSPLSSLTLRRRSCRVHLASGCYSLYHFAAGVRGVGQIKFSACLFHWRVRTTQAK